MSTSRYLNWSRPSPGRHPLRKQMSCIESFSSNSGRSLSVNNLASVPPDRSVDFATFVTTAIIHTNRFQNYHTYHQAHRGTAFFGSGGSGIPHHPNGQPVTTLRARPASATTSASSRPASSSAMPRRVNAPESRKVLAKQLSLDQSPTTRQIPAPGHAWMTSDTSSVSGGLSVSPCESDQCFENPKINGIKKRPPGAGVKNECVYLLYHNRV